MPPQQARDTHARQRGSRLGCLEAAVKTSISASPAASASGMNR